LDEAVIEKKFDVLLVLVFMFDRLGRKDDETPFIVEWFVQQGIEVWSVKEGEQRFDTDAFSAKTKLYGIIHNQKKGIEISSVQRIHQLDNSVEKR